MQYNIGTIVRYRHDGDIGIITEVYPRDYEFLVQWSDGKCGRHIESEVEVICK